MPIETLTSTVKGRYFFAWRFLIPFVCFCGMILATLSVGYGAAPDLQESEEERPRYDGADIVFLIDQSGSMCGLACGSRSHPTANDADNRRFEVSRFALNFIGQLRYSYIPISDRPWDVDASVIYFGSLTETVQSREIIVENLTIEPDNSGQWQTVWSTTEPLLLPDDFMDEEGYPLALGNTDFRTAFAAAMQQFSQMEGSGRRRRAIIVVTDGAPSPWFYEARVDHMQKLQNDVTNSFSGPDDRFYVVGLNDANDPHWTGGPNNNPPAMKPYWQSIVDQRGFAELVPQNEDVTVSVQRAINDILDPLICKEEDDPACPQLVTDSVKVLPYLQQITFILHKIKIDDQVVFRNGSEVIDLEGENVTRFDQDKLVETIVIRNPPPGIWQVERLLDRKVTVFKWELLQPIFELKLSVAQENLGCGRPTTTRLNFLRPGGLPVEEHPEYPVNLQLEYRWPDGAQALDMGRPISAGIYEQRDILRGKGTDVEVWLTASTNDPEGLPISLYDGVLERITTPDCRWEFIAPLPSQMAQYDILTPTLALFDGSHHLPLFVPDEFEMLVEAELQGAGLTSPLQATRATDDRSAWLTLQPNQCSDITLNPLVTIRDIVTGQEQQVTTGIGSQTIGVACKDLVKMVVSPPSKLRVASPGTLQGPACDLMGNTALSFQVELKDEQDKALSPQNVLQQPGSLPFASSVTVSSGGSSWQAEEKWLPEQLPPSGLDYTWLISQFTTRDYEVTVDFTGDVTPSYIKEPNSTHYQMTLALLPPENLVLWRSGLSLLGALAVLLLALIFYYLSIRPTLGPVLQGQLILENPNMTGLGIGVLGTFGKTTMELPNRKQAVFTHDAYSQLEGYADRLEVRQDPKRWDQIKVTPVIDKVRQTLIEIEMGYTVDLPRRLADASSSHEVQDDSDIAYDFLNQPDGSLSPGMLEYQGDDEEARRNWITKSKNDKRKVRLTVIISVILSLLAATISWFFLPLGC